MKRDVRAVVSAALPDGTLVETVFRPEAGETALLTFDGRQVREHTSLRTVAGVTLIPYSPRNNLFVHRAVLLPSAAGECPGAPQVFERVRFFIHRYVDLDARDELLAATYVLLTWVYDRFSELPYLRVRGDYGTGKSRFLATLGALCYKATFASGASSTSPLFRLLDAVAGTLVLDEGDFRFSDEKAEVVKILNNGNSRGFPVLRTETTKAGEFHPAAFSVFGPKILATRKPFEDPALESRCLTLELNRRRPAGRVPLNLPPAFETEAIELRNILLGYRFSYWRKTSLPPEPGTLSGEARTAQLLRPLLSVAPTIEARTAVAATGQSLDDAVIREREDRPDVRLLRLLLDRRAETATIGWLAEEYGARFAGGDTPTPRWIGYVVRERLGLRTERRHGVFRLAEGQGDAIRKRAERIGLLESGDIGDIGDVAGSPGS